MKIIGVTQNYGHGVFLGAPILILDVAVALYIHAFSREHVIYTKGESIGGSRNVDTILFCHAFEHFI